MLLAAQAMQEACAAACEMSADLVQRNGYRQAADEKRQLAAKCRAINSGMLVESLPGAPELPTDGREAFEQIAKIEFFNLRRRETGEYFYPITERTWKIWQYAMEFKAHSEK